MQKIFILFTALATICLEMAHLKFQSTLFRVFIFKKSIKELNTKLAFLLHFQLSDVLICFMLRTVAQPFCRLSFSSLTSKQFWRLTTRRTTASGLSSTWMLLTCVSPPSLPLPLRARLRMTAWMSMSGDQVCDFCLKTGEKPQLSGKTESVCMVYTFWGG